MLPLLSPTPSRRPVMPSQTPPVSHGCSHSPRHCYMSTALPPQGLGSAAAPRPKVFFPWSVRVIEGSTGSSGCSFLSSPPGSESVSEALQPGASSPWWCVCAERSGRSEPGGAVLCSVAGCVFMERRSLDSRRLKQRRRWMEQKSSDV